MIEYSKRPMILGNWKMNGSLAENVKWASQVCQSLSQQPVEAVSLGVCVPFPYLFNVHPLLPSNMALGAQDVSSETHGAFTGEVSAHMLSEHKCRYVLVGHSERRARMGETNDLIARKFQSAKNAGLVPVLCVGETARQRDGNETTTVITTQLAAVIKRCGASALQGTVIAYEPVWAIGTGQTASPSEITAVHTTIFDWLHQHHIPRDSVHVVYGGSVNAHNSADIFALEGVDGGLIGGASLKPDQFLDIARSAERHPLTSAPAQAVT